MVLDPLALSELLDWRGPNVFALASQIFFKTLRGDEKKPAGRITEFEMESLKFSISKRTKVKTCVVLCTPAAFFSISKEAAPEHHGKRESLLAFLLGRRRVGTVAWKLGFESLFCPASKVWHSHRATYRRLFAEEEISRSFVETAACFYCGIL